MGTILDTIADYAKERVAADKQVVSLEEMIAKCEKLGLGDGKSFYDNLKQPGLSFICEVKKASPSKGVIAEDFPYVDIAKEYELAEANCISCLTEPKWFLGSDEIFTEIRAAVKTPMIRKDFVVDEYQIYQARVMGANAVLLIVAILGEERVREYLKVCEKLGLAAIVETHDEEEVQMAINAGAKILGVNNRNLKDFTVDVGNSGRLRELVPEDIVFVAESGIKGVEDIAALKAGNVDAVLIGELLMRSPDKKEMLDSLRNA